MAAGNQQKHLSWIFLVNSKLKFYSETRNVKISKSRKIGNFVSEHKSFPAPAKCPSHKSLEIQASSITKQRTLTNQRFVNKDV